LTADPVWASRGSKEGTMQDRWMGTVRAPDFPAGVDWLNVSQPLRLADLRGHIVILDFWTFC